MEGVEMSESRKTMREGRQSRGNRYQIKTEARNVSPLPVQDPVAAYITTLQQTVGNRVAVQILAAQRFEGLAAEHLDAESVIAHHTGVSHNERLAMGAMMRTATVAAPGVQRQAVTGGGAAPGNGEGVDLIFIIRSDDDYTTEVSQYVKGVLAGQTAVVIDNLEDLFANLAAVAPGNVLPRQKVRRIRIVAHGGKLGGVNMVPAGKVNHRWFSPEEVQAFAADSRRRALIRRVMAPGAQVEFWGCNIGGVDSAGRAWSNLFQAEFSATPHTFRTGNRRYYRRPDRGEPGQVIADQKGKWVRVTSTAEVDSRNRKLKSQFSEWLLTIYRELAENGDISPLPDESSQLKYMRDLFDRTAGDIKHIEILPDSKRSGVRPGATDKRWLELWRTFSFDPSTALGETALP
jgi:ribosomal protein L14E/L6E/L27E